MTRKRFRKLLRALNSTVHSRRYDKIVNQLGPGGNKKADNYYLAWCVVRQNEFNRAKWGEILGIGHNISPVVEVRK